MQEAALDGFEILVSRARSGAQGDDRPVAAGESRQEELQENAAANLLAIEELRKKVETLALSVEKMQERPQFIVAKKAHRRDANEATKLPRQWRAVGCGWSYGTAEFRRSASLQGLVQCKRCFAIVPDPETTESESESESGSASSSTDQEEN